MNLTENGHYIKELLCWFVRFTLYYQLDCLHISVVASCIFYILIWMQTDSICIFLFQTSRPVVPPGSLPDDEEMPKEAQEVPRTKPSSPATTIHHHSHNRSETKSSLYNRSDTKPHIFASITPFAAPDPLSDQELFNLASYFDQPLEAVDQSKTCQNSVPQMLSFSIHSQMCMIDNNFFKNKSKKGRQRMLERVCRPPPCCFLGDGSVLSSQLRSFVCCCNILPESTYKTDTKIIPVNAMVICSCSSSLLFWVGRLFPT